VKSSGEPAHALHFGQDVAVPRKQDPNDVIDQFQAAASTSLELWTRMQEALPKSSLDLRKVASRDAFVRVAVEWERFRSHWHIAAINRDSSLYRNSVTKRLRDSVKGGRFSQLEPYLHLALPPQLSVSTVQTLLDPLGRNISFGDSWTDRARDDLAAPYGAKVTSLPLFDLRLVAACEKLRNAIAHMSTHSIAELNSALLVLDPVVDGALVRTSRVTDKGIAAYLHARVGSEQRIEAWHRRLDEVAEKLRA